MHLVIIGNGIAGITAALRVRRREKKWKITVVSGESDHFYSRPALMYIYMGHMRFEDTKPFEDKFWVENRIDRRRGWVEEVDTRSQVLRFREGGTLAYDRLLIASGSKSNKFGWPGQDLPGVQGLYGLQDLELLERNTPGARQAVIVGGGLIGIELGEMLHTRGIHVIFVVREASYWDNAMPGGESAMINNTITEHGMELRLGTNLSEILGDEGGRACAITTDSGDRIECQIVGLTPGVSPNVGFLESSGVETARGVLVDRSFRTSAPNVFAAGDCAELVTPEGERNQIEQLWYTGKMHGEVVGDVICGRERSYDRGIWYNSAKFLDLEWQTYGQVPPDALRPQGQRHLWWEHPGRRKSMRIVLEDGVVVGMNAVGIRQRHRVWEDWIAERRPIDYVLKRLRRSNFDPEFYRRHEKEIVGSLQEQVQ